jgi:hypothetical protein
VSIAPDRPLRTWLHSCGTLLIVILLGMGTLYGGLSEAARRLAAQTRSVSPATWAVTIVLPPRIVAGRPATLAVLGVDGRLASGVTVTLGEEQHVTTDWTGRASFTARVDATYLVAKASGASSATLIDPPPDADVSRPIGVAPVVSLRDQFPICGGGLRGDAGAYIVKINGQPALVIAASPECIVILPGPKASPGLATISIEAPGVQLSATTMLVSFDFEPPNPPLLPGKKGRLVVRVHGAQQKLRILVENETPGVLRFLRGDAQEFVTSGGPQNSAKIKVEVVRSGEFSFHARLLPSPQVETARRYLQAAQPLAPKDLQGRIRRLANQLARHPRDFETMRFELGRIAINTLAGDFRTLLEAAHDAL